MWNWAPSTASEAGKRTTSPVIQFKTKHFLSQSFIFTNQTTVHLIGIFAQIGRTASVETGFAFDAVLSGEGHVVTGVCGAFQVSTRRLHRLLVRRRGGEHFDQLSRGQNVHAGSASAKGQVSERRAVPGRRVRRQRRSRLAQKGRVFRQSSWLVRSRWSRYGALIIRRNFNNLAYFLLSKERQFLEPVAHRVIGFVRIIENIVRHLVRGLKTFAREQRARVDRLGCSVDRSRSTVIVLNGKK